jgi:hypothetical protein
MGEFGDDSLGQGYPLSSAMPSYFLAISFPTMKLFLTFKLFSFSVAIIHASVHIAFLTPVTDTNPYLLPEALPPNYLYLQSVLNITTANFSTLSNFIIATKPKMPHFIASPKNLTQ